MARTKQAVAPKAKRAAVQSATAAPGQYLGYSLQTTRCLIRILEVPPGSLVSVEVFEDVGVDAPDGTMTAEQDKSSLSGNPIADRSPDFWKTFANWVEAVKDNSFDPATTRFEIFVSKPLAGDIAGRFSRASTPQEAKLALDHARTLLWGAAPSFPQKANVAKDLAPHLTGVFGADASLVERVICNFTLRQGSGSAHDDLRASPGLAAVPTELHEATLRYCLGLVKEKIDRAIEQKRPAVLSADEIRLELTAFVRKADRRTILQTYAAKPPEETVQSELSTRTYVRQLELIDSDFDERLHAVNDFLRAAADRAYWSKKGHVQASSFDDFEDNLQRTWDALRRKAALEQKGRPDAEQGQLLYQNCSLHRAQLEGLAVPDHFTPGSFHALSDVEKVGWHPDYKAKLRETSKRPANT